MGCRLLVGGGVGVWFCPLTMWDGWCFRSKSLWMPWLRIRVGCVMWNCGNRGATGMRG
ncbi:hypothetical protein KC19_1G305400 [Ceratodon purpureus]|uniref:Uncharacterized protein n=1 Tax=Ceratodon purpureus TaxID=3225 RepID=A0A8T0JDZ6_CERPU|nr:hypothetical protein KC19_1G305400 [Ceratodon purpureus]